MVVNQGATLKATDIYPDNLPDLFWPLRDHFYDQLAKPTATKVNFQSTICEFVRVCDYISSDSIMRTNLRRDINKYALMMGMTSAAQVMVLGMLDELEAIGSGGSSDFYSTRPIPVYTHIPLSSDASPAGISSIYPSDISSFFWVARDHFYDQVTTEGYSREMLRSALCEFISIGDHVASVPFMEKTLRKNFKLFSIKIAMKQERKEEILSILSELEALNVYTARPIPGYSPLKTEKEVARDLLIIKMFVDCNAKQQALIAEAKAFMGTAFGDLLTPTKIATRLKVTIRGQDAAMDALGLIGHKIMAQIRLKQADSEWEFRPPHAFLVGRSGCGKTQSIIELCKIIGIPWVRVNAPEVVGEGFKGPTLSYYYEQLKQSGKIPLYAIVLLDEAGKMGKTGSGDDAPKYGGSIMRTLLAHMDGAPVKLPVGASGVEEAMSTSCFTYLATDACAHVPDSVELTAETLSHHTGMPLELVNRFSQGIIKLRPHTTASLVDILKNNPKGPYAHEVKFFKKMYSMDLVIEDEGLKAIAARSIEDSTGARKLEEMLVHILAPLYDIDHLPAGVLTDIDGVRRITLTKEFVEAHLPPAAEKTDDGPPFGMYV